jgi:RNA polymerase sigma factor (sigma-70 family)
MSYVQRFPEDKEKQGQEFLETGSRMARRFWFADADDAIQQIALELWRKLNIILLHENPAAYIASIVRYRMLDMLKENGRRLREEVSLTRWDDGASTEDTGEDASHLTSMPEPLIVPDRSTELVGAKQCLAKVEAVVSEFSQEWQYIFEQCMLHERSEKEVAKEIGLAYGTVRNYVRDIRQALRARCQPEA